MSEETLPTTVDTNPIAALLGIDVPEVNDAEDSDMESSSFIGRIQLMTDASMIVKKNEFEKNHFALIKGKDHVDLGPELNFLPISKRRKALENSPKGLTIVYDKEDPEYIRIKETASEKNSGRMYGWDYLVWLPETKQFATFFCGTISTRRESKHIRHNMLEWLTLRPHFAEPSKPGGFAFWHPQVVVSTATFDPPEAEAAQKEKEKFDNPTPVMPEVVEEAPDDGSREV
jgi:hypothetical protein